MQNLLSWWYSFQALSTIGTILKCVAAILGILILIFGFRESFLRGKAQAADRAAVAQRIGAAEAAAKPRRLTPEQKAAMIARLKDIQPKQRVFICASFLDAEASNFAADIESVLLAAGFEVHFPKGIQADSMIAVGPPGVHIILKDPKVPNPVAYRIQRCFMDSGIETPALAAGDSQFDTNRLEIAVGQK
jgi:hypothetical protein